MLAVTTSSDDIHCTIWGFNRHAVGAHHSRAGIYIDYLMAIGNPEPYTQALLWFTVISLAAIPLFYFAGRFYETDKARLNALVHGGLKG